MITQYRTAFWADQDRAEFIQELNKLGIFMPAGEYSAVEFYDNDVHFVKLLKLFDTFKIALDKKSIYTDEERAGSKYLEIASDWHNGYPKPEDDYLEECYDLSNYCEECGIGARQVKPLRLINEPKWGRRQVFSLNWIFDELFVLPATYKTIMQPLGIEKRKVVWHKKNLFLKTVVQLDIPVIDCDLKMDGYSFEVCNTCYTKKYLPVTVGGCPSPVRDTHLPMFKSREYFGSGASANKMLFVNQQLYKDFRNKLVKGVFFDPVFDKS